MKIENIFNSYDISNSYNLKSALLGGHSVVIVGAGILGRKSILALKKWGVNIVAVVDNNREFWGTKILEIPVLSPEEAAEKYGKQSYFVICIWSPGHSITKVNKQFGELGIKKIFHVAKLIQIFPDGILPHFHFQTPDFFIAHKSEITTVFDLLMDEESKRQFLAQLRHRLVIDFGNLPAPEGDQYFAKGIVKLTGSEVFLDAGAFDGDTFREFEKKVNFSYKCYIGLEPDPNNFSLLKANLQGKDNVILDPYAVGDKNEVLGFKATGGEGASVSSDGEIQVRCVRIDDQYYHLAPTFMKFDIEGAELSALNGARKTIASFTPIIAICIYHKPEDIFVLPLEILKINPNYRFYVRTHSIDGFEFVLYAIPENRLQKA